MEYRELEAVMLQIVGPFKCFFCWLEFPHGEHDAMACAQAYGWKYHELARMNHNLPESWLYGK